MRRYIFGTLKGNESRLKNNNGKGDSMNDAKKLYQTTKLVKGILERDERARNSDSFLYLEVIRAVGEIKGIDVETMTVPYFLLHMKDLGIAGFETVRRSRQKLQEKNEELRACADVEAMRMLNEEAYRIYAKMYK